MRIRVLGDLHVEFAPFDPPRVDADAVVLAGDTHVGVHGIRWAAETFAGQEVIYIAGNHEYYGHAIPHLTLELRALAETCGVHFLDNNAVRVRGVRFLGCTLWTDFRACGDLHGSMLAAQQQLTDYQRIRVSPAFRRLHPADTARWHAEAVRWLRRELAEDAGPTVVVTHHAPSLQSLASVFAEDPLNAAFASSLEGLVAESQAALWVHGHTHSCADYRIGNTRVISNQRGYPHEPAAGFDPVLVLEI